MNEMKNTLDGINSKMEEADKQINDLENRSKESNPAEQKDRKKKIMQSENRLRDLSDSIKFNNFHFIGVSGKRRER